MEHAFRLLLIDWWGWMHEHADHGIAMTEWWGLDVHPCMHVNCEFMQVLVTCIEGEVITWWIWPYCQAGWFRLMYPCLCMHAKYVTMLYLFDPFTNRHWNDSMANSIQSAHSYQITANWQPTDTYPSCTPHTDINRWKSIFQSHLCAYPAPIHHAVCVHNPHELLTWVWPDCNLYPAPAYNPLYQHAGIYSMSDLLSQ